MVKGHLGGCSIDGYALVPPPPPPPPSPPPVKIAAALCKNQIHLGVEANAMHHYVPDVYNNTNNNKEVHPGASPISRAEGFCDLLVSIGACAAFLSRRDSRTAVKAWKRLFIMVAI